MQTKNFYSVILALLLLCLFVTGCLDGITCHRGSGTVVKQNRNISTFDKISLEGSGNIILTQGQNESVTVETDDNIQNNIKTYVRDRTLIITNEGSICPTKLNAYVSFKNLQNTAIEGSGSINNTNAFNLNYLKLDIEGSGTIKLTNLIASQTELSISGSGNIILNGSCHQLNCEIDGSGDIESTNYLSEISSVAINGSGDCKINVKNELNVNISGSGSV